MAPWRKLAAEALGTFFLVFVGCGSAVLTANFVGRLAPPAPADSYFNVGVGFIGVALAFGLTVMMSAYAIGHISGCHLNPAVTIGLATAGRFPNKDVAPYIVAQTLGAILGALVLYGIAIGDRNFDLVKSGFACNGFTHGDGADHSPGHYSLVACMMTEIVLTFIFLIVIIGSTDKRAPAGFAPIAIGLSLTALHLVGIPVTNMSVNPSRSTATALVLAVSLTETWALQQLWLFWVAPIIGGFLAGAVYRSLWPDTEPTKSASQPAAQPPPGA